MASNSCVPSKSLERPGPEVLWRLVRRGAEWSCELRPQRVGVEAVILRDGAPFTVRSFHMHDVAAMWAAMEREDL